MYQFYKFKDDLWLKIFKKYKLSTLQQQFPGPKFRRAPDLQTNVVYKFLAPTVCGAILVKLAER